MSACQLWLMSDIAHYRFIVTFRGDKSKLCSILLPPSPPFDSL